MIVALLFVVCRRSAAFASRLCCSFDQGSLPVAVGFHYRRLAWLVVLIQLPSKLHGTVPYDRTAPLYVVLSKTLKKV
uniref:Secreted protein n=1 Tax=Trichuris muris TaxID=70415 RepID=A0A5S6QVG4_TRIMR